MGGYAAPPMENALTSPRSLSLTGLALLASSLLFACNGSAGDTCIEHDDCSSGLLCCKASPSVTARGTCQDVPMCSTTPVVDSGTADSSTVDSSVTDAGSTDSGTADSGATDSGPTDSGVADGATDGGSTDSGATDSGATDSGTADSGAADSGTADSGTADTGAV